MNSNWPRWIQASISTHFGAHLSPLVLREADIRQHLPAPVVYNLKTSGPIMTQNDAKHWTLRTSVHVDVLELQTNDGYSPQRNIGIVAAACTPMIPVYKYGNGLLDTQESLGCLSRESEIVPIQWGNLKIESRVLQVTIEAVYEINLTQE